MIQKLDYPIIADVKTLNQILQAHYGSDLINILVRHGAPPLTRIILNNDADPSFAQNTMLAIDNTDFITEANAIWVAWNGIEDDILYFAKRIIDGTITPQEKQGLELYLTVALAKLYSQGSNYAAASKNPLVPDKGW